MSSESKRRFLGVVRVSKQDLAEGYGPAIQEAELVADAAAQGYEAEIRRIVEPATISLDERGLFRNIVSSAIEDGDDGLSFSRCDCLSRTLDGAIQVALDLKKAGLTIRLVRENQWVRPDDPPIAFVMFVLQSFGVDAQSRVFFANAKAGQHKAAEAGKLPAGCGPGLLGYTVKGGRFEPNGFLPVCAEILGGNLKGRTINEITRALQGRGVSTPNGKPFTRTTVAGVLRKAERYAGVWRWGGHEIRGLIPPIITEGEAQRVLANLKLNRERSYGYGRRKWATGRVFCGLCNRRWNLKTCRACQCPKSNPLDANPTCPAPKVTWKRLDGALWFLLVANLSNREALEHYLRRGREHWMARRSGLLEEFRSIAAQIRGQLERKRRLSYQHEEGVISDSELKKRLKGVAANLGILEERLAELEDFLSEPAFPPVQGLHEWWPCYLWTICEKATDQEKAEVAELIDARFTVSLLPGGGPGSFDVQMSARIPVGMPEAAWREPNTPSQWGDVEAPADMVFASPGRCSGRGRAWGPYSWTRMRPLSSPSRMAG